MLINFRRRVVFSGNFLAKRRKTGHIAAAMLPLSGLNPVSPIGNTASVTAQDFGNRAKNNRSENRYYPFFAGPNLSRLTGFFVQNLTN
ncbi:hypothetical protein [Mixta intestinalis]|uniref:hypothetical protein n=1 Tax=Mixta intestinalis TaxID=1615494 RepID=UPI0013710737|nr:hypothetical protein [Mixta intestinalis]